MLPWYWPTFSRVGLAGCDMGACALLPRIIGQGRASELLYTGRTMDAAEGERWGFYNALVERDALLAEQLLRQVGRQLGAAQAQLAAIAEMGPAVSSRKVDSAARSVIESAGFGKYFSHGLGHGIGLEIHEAPRMSPQGETTLQPGMVITVEPGIYLPGVGGVRIEDDVLITRDGAEVLTSVPKSWESCRVDFV